MKIQLVSNFNVYIMDTGLTTSQYKIDICSRDYTNSIPYFFF